MFYYSGPKEISLSYENNESIGNYCKLTRDKAIKLVLNILFLFM